MTENEIIVPMSLIEGSIVYTGGKILDSVRLTWIGIIVLLFFICMIWGILLSFLSFSILFVE